MRKAYFVLFILCAAPALFGQQPTSLPALKGEAVKEVDKLQTLTQQMADEIFSFNELGFQEFETSRYVTGMLEKNGFHIEREEATAFSLIRGNAVRRLAGQWGDDCQRAGAGKWSKACRRKADFQGG